MYKLKSFDNGFEYIEIQNDATSAKIALQGAHIFEYKRSNEEPILWLSEVSSFESGVAIRGGVPICWPAFGMNNPDLPQHGFARTAMFQLISVEEKDKHSSEVLLRLTDTKESLKLWNHKFELDVKISVGETLEMELITRNLDTKEFKYTQALHSYFNISDISDVTIKGLKNKPRYNSLSDKTFLQKTDITINEEFDSVFQKADEELILECKNRTISIKNEGSSSVIVWNPWIDKGSKMSGMKADAYREFVCIESANAFEDFRVLKPDEIHALKATIKVVKI